jgi:hypothetical protein
MDFRNWPAGNRNRFSRLNGKTTSHLLPSHSQPSFRLLLFVPRLVPWVNCQLRLEYEAGWLTVGLAIGKSEIQNSRIQHSVLI